MGSDRRSAGGQRGSLAIEVGEAQAGIELCCSEPLRVVSWNVHKGVHPRFAQQLRALVHERDPHLCAFQEARSKLAVPAGYGGHHARSFRRAFRGHGEGVMTVSVARALDAHRMRSSERELFVFTPKSALISHYGVDGAAGRLTVVNVHGLNFDPSGKQLARQLDELHVAIDALDGPLVVCGDFNTWNESRLGVVHRIAVALDLIEVASDIPGGRKGDARSKRFERLLGLDRRLHLDRMLVRGLRPRRSAWLEAFDASDHVPLFAEFDWEGS